MDREIREAQNEHRQTLLEAQDIATAQDEVVIIDVVVISGVVDSVTPPWGKDSRCGAVYISRGRRHRGAGLSPGCFAGGCPLGH